MEAKLRKIVDFYERELHAYPFPNPAKVTYLLNDKVLCQYEVNYFFQEDLKTVQEYAQDLKADKDEKKGLLEWYLTGNSILTNPNFLCDDRGTMDYLNGIRVPPDVVWTPPHHKPEAGFAGDADCDDEEDCLPF